MKYIFYTLLFSLLLSGSCIIPPPAEPEREIYYLDQEMYDYVIFPTGSWWVYEEENSGIIDSLSITSASKEVISTDRLSYDFEEYSIKINTSQGQVRGYVSNLLKGANGYGDYIERSSDHPSAPTVYKYISCIEVGDTVNPSQGIYIAKYDTLNTLEVENETYSSIQVFHQISENEPIYKYYYAKGVGLIKEEDIENNQTWNLIDYHINN